MAITQASLADDIFDPVHLRSAYQPIVDLATGDVVGAEALARWPGLPVDPGTAFDEAQRTGRAAELDALCQRAAIDGTRDVGLPPGFTLFVNVEPGSPVTALTTRPVGGPRLMAEITERALLHDPAGLLRSIGRMRAQGCGIALDDVGAVPESLALLPFVAPDVVKLDITLVHMRPNADRARILTAVSAYAEASGATILAEGVETEAHRLQALALGATLGQGWYYGRPGPLGGHPEPRSPISRLGLPPTRTATPFDLVGPGRLRTGSKELLLAISHHIEQQAMTLDTPPLLLGAFQDAGRFTPDTRRRYTELARRCPLVVALGAGIPTRPAAGVRGVDLAASDPLIGEWTVVVVGAHYAGALIAQDLGDLGPDRDRRFRFTLTHDHDTVLAAARSLLART